jgi:cytochrome c1
MARRDIKIAYEGKKMKVVSLTARKAALMIFLTTCLTVAGPGCGKSVSETDQGVQALEEYGCIACHTIPGVKQANGVVGPPLNFWASRSYIAGSLLNNSDNLVRWLMDPQAIEPGTVMPATGLGENDAHDIGEYLYTLQAGSKGHASVRGFSEDSTFPPPAGIE